MNWGSDLIKRATIVVLNTAFEIVDSEEFGMRVIVVTDCLDETQKAVFIPEQGQPFEKCSSFKEATRRDEVEKLLHANWSALLEEYKYNYTVAR